MSKDKDESGNGKRTNPVGSTAAEDSELTSWLNRLWARNEPPERLELWQTFGRNKVDRGEMIHHEDFKPNEKLDIEQANRVANEIMAAAQNDCDSLRREATYQLAIIDRNRKAAPLVRRIGPLQPKRTYAIGRSGGSSFDSLDDEEPLDARSIEMAYVKAGHEEARWDKTRNDRVIGEMLLLQDNIIRNQQAVLDKMFAQHVTMFQQMQEAQDRSLDRELARKREEFKMELWQDGKRTAMNLLPGLFAKPERPESNGASNGHNGTKFGPSPERTLVDNFLNDCEKAKISIALFGNFEEEDGKLTQKEPGIFTIKQFGILVGVRDGHYPPSKLDELVPKWGHKNAVTEEQIQKAMSAGVTEGIGMALYELISLRQRRRDEREANQVVDGEIDDQPKQ